MRIAPYATPKPRVLLAADSLEQGASGIARVARLMARVLGDEVERGAIEADAIVLRGGGRDLPIPVRSARGSRLRLLSRIHRAALTHSHFLYDFSGIARAHPRVGALDRPYLTWIHGIEVWEHAEEKRLSRARAARVLAANSQYTLERASRLHPGLDHAQVCWLATESDASVPELPLSRDRPPIAMILARIDEREDYKGHRELIACWPSVVSQVPSARLRIVGGGPGRGALTALAAQSPARASIDLVGFVPEHALGQLFRKSALLAMPSRGEGFGLAYAEAMRHGLPVIGSVHDAAREVNVDGVTGYNVDLKDEHALPQRIITLLTQPEIAASMGRAAQQRWRDELCYSRFAQRFLPILRSLWT